MDGNRKAAPGAAGAANEKNFDVLKHTSPAPKATTAGHMTKSRIYASLSDACAFCSLVLMPFVAGLAEPQPMMALLAVSVALLLWRISVLFTKCYASAVKSQQDDDRSRVDGSRVTASRGILRASPSNPWNGRRGRTTCER